MEVSNTDDRVIVLVDMDCFYVQVEQKLCPEYQDKPCAVVQYKTYKGGGIIAVNYEARARGVTRFLRGAEAQEVCPEIHLFRVPEVRGKADLTKYRDAGASVLNVLCEYSDCVERASIDEAYIDMTSAIKSKIQDAPPVTADQLLNTFVIGWEAEDPECNKGDLQKWLDMIYEEEHLYHDRMLAYAAVIVEEMRNAVYEKTGYRCSAGVANNKMLSKLSCGIHKPNKQTVLPQSSIPLLFKTLPIKKVRNLGGKLGESIVKKFSVEKMGDLIDIPKSQLVGIFGEKTGLWLYGLVRGMDNEPVTSRQLPKSIGCGKNFPGKSSLGTRDDVIHWLKQLSIELEERLKKDQKDNRRFARLLTISLRTHENGVFSLTSRSCPIYVYNAEKLAHDALLAINKLNTSSDTLWKPSIWTLSMAASKFEDKLDSSSYCDIQSYFSGKSSSINDVSQKGCCSSPSTTSVTTENSTMLSGTVETESKSSLMCIKDSDNAKKSIASYFTIKNSNCKELHNEECESAKSSESTFTENKAEESLNAVGSKCSIVSFFNKKQLAEPDPQDNSELASSKTGENGKNKDQNSVTFHLDNSANNIVNNCESSDTAMEETFCTNDNSNVSSGELKKMGFFAKKLKERSEINLNVELACPCDDAISEPSKVTETEVHFSGPSTSTSKNVQNLHYNTNENDDEYSSLDPELTKLCEKCNKPIPIWEEMEHLDYHLALDLSKEFSNKTNSSNSFVSKSSIMGRNIPTKSKSGRKRGSTKKISSQAKKPLIQTKTIDAFFK